jgi:hypothetical protein
VARRCRTSKMKGRFFNPHRAELPCGDHPPGDRTFRSAGFRRDETLPSDSRPADSNLRPVGELATLDQLVQLEGVADGMHDSVLQHRVNAVSGPPSRWVLGSLQLFIVNIPERRRPPPLENVL